MPEASGEPMSQRPTLFIALATALPLYMIAPIALANSSSDAFIELLNSLQSHQAGQGITYSNQGSNDEPGTPTNQTAEEYYISDLDAVVQLNCVVCHKSGGNAPNSGARLVFNSSAEANHVALSDFVSTGGGDPDWVLSKIAGGSGHGGGQIVSSGSNEYQAFEQYFALLSGDATSGSGDSSDFWEGIVMEPREVTLRRASLLLAARVASDESIERAKASDAALRGEIIKLMRGDGFHDFLISGADDRLLTDGLVNGVAFDIRTDDRFPAHNAYLNTLPPDNAEPAERESFQQLYFTRIEGDQALRWSIHREPLELIAHIVETNQSYKKILTADYTMVNPLSNIAYRAGLSFDADYVDKSGFLEKDKLNTYKPGRNRGHIAWAPPFDFNYQTREFIDWPDYHEWPHAGVLSTMAWMSRYPSTDTNRNRARARWTYYHFLGVDIEKSAPRTTDPVALADTNNPTMNNPACTVCHERLDPVAGAYQLYGDAGHYLDQTFGFDSLPESYKHPERFGNEPGSTGYRDGDTWYRDMRSPGFEGKTAPTNEDSLQWLARQIAEDPRFAAATVKFWWPAIFGAEALIAPEDPDGPDYSARINTYNAQEQLVSELAERFVASDYRLKNLLADMLMSPWYRLQGLEDPSEANIRSTELGEIGSGRLLTPEELDRKNVAVFGRRWGQVYDSQKTPYRYGYQSRLGDEESDSLKVFYGGTDSAGLTLRNRKKTALMSSVSETMASELACQAVAYDLFLPEKERTLFTHVSPHLGVGDVAEVKAILKGTVEDRDRWLEHKTIIHPTSLLGGRVRISISTEHDEYPYRSTDGQATHADLLIKEIIFRQGAEVTASFRGEDISDVQGFNAAKNSEGEFLGEPVSDGDHTGWRARGESWLAFEADLPAGDYNLELRLASSLQANNVNKSVGIRAHVTAIENKENTRSTQAIRDQIHDMLLRAYNRPPSTETVDYLLTELEKYAEAILLSEGNRWISTSLPPDEPCNQTMIWRDGYYSRNADPRGMIRAWIAMTHAVMGSFAYLHD